MKAFVAHGKALIKGVDESRFDTGHRSTHYAFAAAAFGNGFGDFEEFAACVHQFGEFEGFGVGVEAREYDVVVWHLDGESGFECYALGECCLEDFH